MDQMEPEKIDEDLQSENPDDVAVLYSWAKLQGAKYRDFSASRRAYRAQMRHRAAEAQREAERGAQLEAEAAAAATEKAAREAEEAARFHESAARQVVGLAKRGDSVAEEAASERAMRAAAELARRASQERIEAARRAEAVAAAEAAARREEREMAEAHASAQRQAKRYNESDIRRRALAGPQPTSVGGTISDPYTGEVSQTRPDRIYHQLVVPEEDMQPSRYRQSRDSARLIVPQPDPVHPPESASPAEYWAVGALDREAEIAAAGDAARLASRDGAVRFYEPKEPTREPRIAERESRVTGRPPKYSEPESGITAPRQVEARPRMDVSASSVVAPIGGRLASGIRVPAGYRAEHSSEPRAVVESRPMSEPPRAASVPRPVYAEPAYQEPPYRAAMEPRAAEPVRPESVRAAAVPTEPIVERRAKPRPQQRAEYRPEFREDDMPQGYLEPRREHLPEPSLEPSMDDRSLPPAPLEEPRVERRLKPRPDFRNVPLMAPRPEVRPEPRMEPRRPEPRPEPRSDFRPELRPDPRDEFDVHEPREPEHTVPAWIYSQPQEPAATRRAQQPVSPVEESLQHTRERVASRWFALKGVFEQGGAEPAAEAAPQRAKDLRAPLLTVFSLAGGVGKTSLIATLGRALSSTGERVLLTDTTSHGLLPFYFGASELRAGTVRTFAPPEGSTDAPIYLVSYDVNQRNGDAATQDWLSDELTANSRGMQRVLVDLTPGAAWVARRLARMNSTMLVPVAPDMNSVISLQGVEKFFGGMVDGEGRPVQPFYVLNQFDASLPLHLDVREVMRQQLGDRLLPFAIRRAPAVSEALAEGMTVMDYAPDSPVAEDYMNLVSWLRMQAAPAPTSFRNARWSER